MPLSLQLISGTAGHYVGSSEGFIFFRWINACSVDAVTALDSAFARAAAKEKLVWLTIVEGRMTKHELPRDVRIALAKTLSTNGDRLAGAAVAIEGDPIATTPIRGVVTSIDTLVPFVRAKWLATYPSNVFNEPASACEWLAGLLAESGGTPFPEKTMLALVNEVRNKT